MNGSEQPFSKWVSNCHSLWHALYNSLANQLKLMSQAHYTFRNLSLESKLRTRQFFETLNFLGLLSPSIDTTVRPRHARKPAAIAAVWP